jgi:hypothetical protein
LLSTESCLFPQVLVISLINSRIRFNCFLMTTWYHNLKVSIFLLRRISSYEINDGTSNRMYNVFFIKEINVLLTLELALYCDHNICNLYFEWGHLPATLHNNIRNTLFWVQQINFLPKFVHSKQRILLRSSENIKKSHQNQISKFLLRYIIFDLTHNNKQEYFRV